MGKARWFLPVFTLFFLVHRAAIGQQPIHWDASIDSAKAVASQSNRLVLVFFCAGYCGPCHRMENDLRNQPGAVTTLEASFVPVKISAEYYPNTAKQYGVTRLPTTVILAPNARGDVLALIPEYVPIDQYLSKLNKVAADAKRHDAGVFAQIQASPPVGAAVGSIQPPVSGPANPAAPAQAAVTQRPNADVERYPTQSPNSLIAGPAIPSGGGSAMPASPAAPAPASPMRSMAAGTDLSAGHAIEPPKAAGNVKPPVRAPLGLDGFCPVQLVENSRWQPGKKAWGAIHRGRTYLFTGEDERRRFLANPDHYAPVSSGDDVVLLLEQGRSISGYREHGLQFEGHVYLFSAEETLNKFRSNPRYFADRALQAMLSPSQTAAR